MENVMTMGSFCEMNEDEMLVVDGGATVGEVILGTIGIVAVVAVAPVAVAAATGEWY